MPINVGVRLVADVPMAWRHHCGRLNEGMYQPGAICADCHVDVPREDVEGRYLLVEMG